MERERTAADWLAMIAAVVRPERNSAWPACGAKLRGPRAGRTCRAAGCGLGGRCYLHGGVPGHRPRGMSDPRSFVLFAGGSDEASRWSFWAVPLDIFERLPPESQRFPDAEDMPLEIAEVMRSDGTRVGRFGARVRWPAILGFRIVKRLAERGRVAFVIFSDADRLAVLRAQRERAPEGQPPTRVVRVDGEAFARAMAQAGQTPRRKMDAQSGAGVPQDVDISRPEQGAGTPCAPAE